MFAGSNATESQRATRGVLEHWAQVNSGAVDPNPEVSAKDIKAAQLKSSVGKALKFPAEILGDVYANPYPKRDRRQEARDAIAAREAASLKGELMEGWSKVAEEDKTMKTAFSAMKSAPAAADVAPEGVPAITDFFKPKPQPDGTITHFYKPEENGKQFDIVEETVVTPKVSYSAERQLPPVKYSACDNSVPANGSVRNTAPTSL